MQTHNLNSRPSGRYSGNVAEAIQELRRHDIEAFSTADGLLALMPERIRLLDLTEAAFDDQDAHIETPHVFPIVAGRVDLGAVAAFIGH